MKPADVRWERSPEFSCGSKYAGWRLFSVPENRHLGTVFADGSWYCAWNMRVTRRLNRIRPGSQPLAAQALLRAAGVEP